MKRLIILLILLFCTPANAGVVMMCGDATVTETTCAVYDELTGTEDNTVVSESGGYIGQGLYDPATNITICKLGFNFYTDPGGATVTMAVYTNDSNNLGSVVVSATGAISGTGWKYLDVTPTALSHGTAYHIVTKVGGATARIYDSATLTLDEGELTVWTASGTKASSHSEYDAGVRIYNE